MERFKQKLQAAAIPFRENEPLAAHCTFKIGGPAQLFVMPENEQQLCSAVALCKEQAVRYYLLGNGSNILFADEGFRGAVIDVSAEAAGMGLSIYQNADGDYISAPAGLKLSELCKFALQHGYTGLEFAYGIPGTVGGGVCMNAGAYGGEMKQVLRSAAVLFPEEGIRTLSCEELNLSYRHSLLTEHPEAVVLYAEFELTPGDPEAIRAAMRELMAKRKASQPLEWPSAGSTFKRPEGHFAGTLIDQCGLKGLTVGGAQVSEKHAGFLINRGGATFADMAELIRQVQQRVLEETGVTLEPEVKIVK